VFLKKDLQLGQPLCIAATGDRCGEGILWEAATQSIYWTDINRFLVHRYRLERAELKTWFFCEPVTCVLATNRSGTLLLVLGSGAALWEPEQDVRHAPLFTLPEWPLVRCNDGAIDPRGDLWIGSMHNNVSVNGEPGDARGWDGVLYRVNARGGSSQWRRDIGISNTLLWSPDHSRFYFGDTLKNQIWSYDYDLADGSIHNERTLFEGFSRGLPDGSAIDADGYIWNCRYGGGCIVRFAADGSVDRVIEMPVSNPTNCTFGGPMGNILYVSSASLGTERWEQFGGCLFAIETNVCGVPASPFRCS